MATTKIVNKRNEDVTFAVVDSNPWPLRSRCSDLACSQRVGLDVCPNVWVFIAQLVEHCSANAEVKGSNSVEAPKISFRA